MKTDPKIEKAIIDLAKTNNFTASQISEKLNIKFSTVYSVCKRLKLEIPKEKRGGKNIKDLTNQRFSSLLVLNKADSKKEYSNTAWWNCLCDCGKKCIKNGTDLRQGKTKTCGCRISIKSRTNWKGYGDIPKSKWRILNKNALQRNLEFNLTIEFCDKLFKDQDKKCYLSGMNISFEDNTASIDRIDNTKGYIRGNVAWCHKDINKCKQTFTKDEFIFLCKKVSENNGT